MSVSDFVIYKFGNIAYTAIDFNENELLTLTELTEFLLNNPSLGTAESEETKPNKELYQFTCGRQAATQFFKGLRQIERAIYDNVYDKIASHVTVFGLKIFDYKSYHINNVPVLFNILKSILLQNNLIERKLEKIPFYIFTPLNPESLSVSVGSRIPENICCRGLPIFELPEEYYQENTDINKNNTFIKEIKRFSYPNLIPSNEETPKLCTTCLERLKFLHSMVNIKESLFDAILSHLFIFLIRFARFSYDYKKVELKKNELLNNSIYKIVKGTIEPIRTWFTPNKPSDTLWHIGIIDSDINLKILCYGYDCGCDDNRYDYGIPCLSLNFIKRIIWLFTELLNESNPGKKYKIDIDDFTINGFYKDLWRIFLFFRDKERSTEDYMRNISIYSIPLPVIVVNKNIIPDFLSDMEEAQAFLAIIKEFIMEMFTLAQKKLMLELSRVIPEFNDITPFYHTSAFLMSYELQQTINKIISKFTTYTENKLLIDIRSVLVELYGCLRRKYNV